MFDPKLMELYGSRDFHRRLATRFNHVPEIRDVQLQHVKTFTKRIENHLQANRQARTAQ